jgi:hypothetical protein
MWFKQAILYKKAELTRMLEGPLAALAEQCAGVWPDAAALDGLLGAEFASVANAARLYVCDADTRQLSAGIAAATLEEHRRGRRLGEQPYDAGNLPFRGMTLTSVFLDEDTLKRSIAAIQAIIGNDMLLGFLVAEFELDAIPLPQTAFTGAAWTQYKGDPAIRASVFDQCRSKSRLDQRLDVAIDTLDGLMRAHGIYHIILHFSSSRAIFWVFDDPYNYRFHSVEEMLDPEIWLAYPARPYPRNAKVPEEKIRQVLEKFKALRESDENIYLRSGSLNVMNGIVGLTFSCDGSHYLTVDEFLNQEHPFWA